MRKASPPWQPVSLLPAFAERIDSLLYTVLDQVQNLRWVLETPCLLDDVTLRDVIALYTLHLADHDRIEAQIARWRDDGLTAAQGHELVRLTLQAARLKAALEHVLQLARRIQYRTRDWRTAERDELDLLEALIWGQGKRTRPRPI